MRPHDELAEQVIPGRFSPDYAGEQTNRGAGEVLARQATSAGASAAPVVRKVRWQDANYVSPGPAPFQCGNCRWIVWGTSRKGQNPHDPDAMDDIDLCSIVAGPYDDEGIKPGDTCRLFAPKPALNLPTPNLLGDMTVEEADDEGSDRGSPASR